MPNDELDAKRYRWWRDNIGLLEEDGDGLIGVAYSFQIRLAGLDADTPEKSSAELMDEIADRGLK